MQGERLGVMVCGHGSRDTAAVEQFASVAERLRPRFPDWPIDYGYLEFATPIIRDGLDALKATGANRILAVPGMLFAAGHAKNDIPSVLNRYQAENGLHIDYGRELGIDLKMLRAAGDRVREALAAAPHTVPLHETVLVVVGRGASDPDANSNVAKVTRMLWESLGFGWAETAYSGVTFPLVAPALDHVARLGYRRVVVFPYFLFTGVLVRRIYDAVDEAARAHPGIEFLKAGYLNDHPLVIDTFEARVREILEGTGNMNCQMCKYREQFLGFESEVGLRQESHHHHVEGIGAGEAQHDHNHHHRGKGDGDRHGHELRRADGHDHEHGSADADDHSHRHSHGYGHSHEHDHAHDHHHHPYPHADHPLGPRTLKRTQ
jgi:sirohydrochlorin cobaltochelatase